MTYFIGGINGVGKSTFLKEVVLKSPEFKILKASSAFMEYLNIEQGDYDSLRDLPDDYKKQEFDKMMEGVLVESSTDEKILLVDAHYFHYRRGEMFDTIGEWLSMMDAMFVVTADTIDIFNRVSNDEKERDLFPINFNEQQQKQMINIYLERTISFAKQLSEKCNVPLVVLENKQNKIKSTVNMFLKAYLRIIDDNE